jgi:atypical dual specificity phosphatase
VGCLPILYIGRKMMHGDPSLPRENKLHNRLTKLAVFSATWSTTALAVGALTTAPLTLAIGAPLLSPYHSLFIYLPFVIMGARADRNTTYGPITRLFFHSLFDFPLFVASYVLREGLGLRLFGPFASVLDDHIVQGSMPFPSDVKTLKDSPYNVCAVINMCYEYSGPTKEYAKHGIEQLRLPHVDTCAPSVESLVLGAAFVKRKLAENPGKRVYIHCKGGIARASTMSLAHYLLNEGLDPKKHVDVIRAKRYVVMREVCEYNCLQELWNKHSLDSHGAVGGAVHAAAAETTVGTMNSKED